MEKLALDLNAKAEFANEGIVSKTLVEEPFSKVILFGFAKGQ